MIFTACVYCNSPIIIPLDERYLDFLEEGKKLYTKEVCEKCGKANFVEHRRLDGETIGEDNPIVKKFTHNTI